MVFENLIALHIAIENQCPQETAFKYLDRLLAGKKVIRKPQFPWTDKDKEDVIKLKAAGVKGNEISRYYGVDPAVITRILKGAESNAKATSCI